MGVSQEQAATSRPLAALGISDMEECTYRALLARHAATAAEIAKQLSISQRMANTLLASIEAKGLATHTPRKPRVYVAAPPEFTIETLIKQRQAMLEQTREEIPGLKDLAAQAGNARGYDRIGFFEVDTGEQKNWTVQLTEQGLSAPSADQRPPYAPQPGKQPQ